MAPFFRAFPSFALVVAGLVMTWGLVFVGAAQQPGYDHLRDSISALASRHAQLPWIGALAISAGGIATIAASILLRRISKPAALALTLAGVALIVVALAPIRCDDGAAGCQMYPGGRDWISKTHLVAVGFYEFASVAAALTAALALLRRGARRAAAVGIVGAVLSLLLFTAAPVGLGVMQRAWLLVHSFLLCCVPYLVATTWGRRASHGAGFSRVRTPTEGASAT